MKRLPVLAVLILAVVAAMIWLVPQWDVDSPTAEPPPPVMTPGAGGSSTVPSRPADAFPLTVDYVFDGDTIEARPHAANTVVPSMEPVRVRLIGIDTPEGTPSPECWAEQARDHLRALLPEGSTVWAAPDVEHRDRYDRALLYLWTEDGRFVNHELVAAGDAEALIVEPNGAHYELMVAAEASARQSGLGRWGAC